VTHQEYLRVIDKYGLKDSDETFFNITLAEILGESIEQDIKRLKEYHAITIPDPHKLAGFAAKWIAKIKPVQLKVSIGINELQGNAASEKTKKEMKVLFINEILAFETGLTILKLSRVKVNDKALIRHLLYTLKYRDTQGETLALIYYQLEKAMRRQ